MLHVTCSAPPGLHNSTTYPVRNVPILKNRYCLCIRSGDTIHATIGFSHRVSQTPANPGYLSQPAQMPRLPRSGTRAGVVARRPSCLNRAGSDEGTQVPCTSEQRPYWRQSIPATRRHAAMTGRHIFYHIRNQRRASLTRSHGRKFTHDDHVTPNTWLA